MTMGPERSPGEYFWEWWQLHQRRLCARPEVRERCESLSRTLGQFRRSGRLLEIGFGDGYLLEMCAPRFECVGVDISRENVRQTQVDSERRGIRGVQLVAADVLDFDSDRNFDVVVANQVVEHFAGVELGRLVEKIRELLLPGSLFVGSVPYKQDLELSKVLCPRCHLVFDPDGHEQSFDEQGVRELLSRLGFHVIHVNTHVRGGRYCRKHPMLRAMRSVYWKMAGFKPHNGLEFVAQRPGEAKC